MNETDLRNQLQAIATTAVPAPRPLPTGVAKRARRRELHSGMLILTAVVTFFAGGSYAPNSSRNLVGSAPVAGSSDQGVVDPPDHAFGSGYSLNAEVIDGRICALFDLEWVEFEYHRASTRMCDPDPTAVLSVGVRLVTLDTEPPTRVVVVAGGVGREVARVELDLPGKRWAEEELVLIPFKDFGRRIAAGALERSSMLDDKGEFSAAIRAFDGQGRVIVERVLCDPAASSDSTCDESPGRH